MAAQARHRQARSRRGRETQKGRARDEPRRDATHFRSDSTSARRTPYTALADLVPHSHQPLHHLLAFCPHSYPSINHDLTATVHRCHLQSQSETWSENGIMPHSIMSNNLQRKRRDRQRLYLPNLLGELPLEVQDSQPEVRPSINKRSRSQPAGSATNDTILPRKITLVLSRALRV